MKKKLQFITLFFVILTYSQTNTWIGTGGTTNWNLTSNWSLGVIPNASHDVVIPTGSTIVVNANAVTKSLSLQGNSVLTISSNLSFTNASVIESNATVNWNSGTISGGGSLNNTGTINLLSSSNKFLSGNNIITNSGNLIISDIGDLYLNNATLNNASSGVIDIQADGTTITYNGGTVANFNNAGLLKKTLGSTNSIIKAKLINTGTFQVEMGTLTIDDVNAELQSGIYNVNSGAQLNWNNDLKVSGNLSGTLEGNINWVGNITVPTSQTAGFNFTGNGSVKWNSGFLKGGGTLINNGKLDLATATNKFISENTILSNAGNLIISDIGDLYLNNSTLNNTSSGIIDVKVDGTPITYSVGTVANFNNAGLLKKTLGSTNSIIKAKLINTGTFQVEMGTLTIDDVNAELQSGIYNVNSGAQLNWNNNIKVSGNLSGALEGNINWVGSIVVPTSQTAGFNFTGNGSVKWNSGYLKGGGTLTNNGKLDLTTATNKFISENTILSNAGNLIISDIGDLYLNNATLNNASSGVIDIQADGTPIRYNGGTVANLNNMGILKKTISTGTAILYPITSNSGTIKITSGSLQINTITNTNNGTISGTGNFIIQNNNFTNNGIFSPGNSPGKLDFTGNFPSSSTSILKIDINGNVQSTDYDFLNIIGNADFQGMVDINLTVPLNNNDEFIVASTSGNITGCTIQNTAQAMYNGTVYNFSVSCINNKNLVLKVVNSYLSTSENNPDKKELVVFPNPVKEEVMIQYDSSEKITGITLYDMSGKLIKNIQKEISSREKINLSELKNGVYIMKIRLRNQSIIKKIIKE